MPLDDDHELSRREVEHGVNDHYDEWMHRIAHPEQLEEAVLEAVVTRLQQDGFREGKTVAEQTIGRSKSKVYFRTADQKLAYLSIGGHSYRLRVYAEDCEHMTADEMRDLIPLKTSAYAKVNCAIGPGAQAVIDDLPTDIIDVESLDEAGKGEVGQKQNWFRRYIWRWGSGEK